MPFSSGTFTRLYDWEADRDADVKIRADRMDEEMDGFADGLSTCLLKDGTQTPTADLPMGGQKHTGVGDATARNNYVSMSQQYRGHFATAAGTANAITLTTSFSLTAYVTGQAFEFVAQSANTSSVTVAVDGLAAKSVKKRDGSALSSGNLVAGGVYRIVYDGTNFQLQDTPGSTGTDVSARIMPVGTTMWWGLTTIPTGWIKLTGTLASKQRATIGDYPELDALYAADGYPWGQPSGSEDTQYFLPPAGERYIRAANADGDIGTTLDDAIAAHTHTFSGSDTVNISGTTNTTGGHTHGGNYLKTDANAGASGFDSGGALGLTQTSTAVTGEATAGSHNHTFSGSDTVNISGTTGSTGDTETRPDTIYQYLIMLVSPAAAAAASSGLFGLNYLFSTATSGSVASGVLRLDNATIASATEIAISDLDNYGADYGPFLATWDDSGSAVRGVLKIHKVTNPAHFMLFHVTGASTDNTTYWTLSVTHVASNGTFAASDSLEVAFTRSGSVGSAAVLNWRDEWADATAYALNDAVSNGGSSYVCISAHTSGASTEAGVGASYLTVWGLLAQKGTDGAGSGDVTAASAFGTDNLIIRSDGTGKGVQATGITVSDTNSVTGVVNLGMSGTINDTNGNEVIAHTATASAVNHVAITNNTTGNSPLIAAAGDDTNVAITIQGKGTGKVLLGDASLQWPDSDGTSGQALITNGSGVLSFSTISGGGGGAGGGIGTNGGRLTLSSGVPVTTSDVTAATTLYWTPHVSGEIALYDGAAWSVLTTPEVSLSLSGFAADTNFDIFGYDNSGTFTLEAVAWSSGTARATALVRQDGVLVKSGATTRRYLGTIRTTATTGQCEDSVSKRFVWNVANRQSRELYKPIPTVSWDYTTATWRSVLADNTLRCEWVCGLAEDIIRATVLAGASNSSLGTNQARGIGIDTTSDNTARLYTSVSSAVAGNNFAAGADYSGNPGIGYHYAQLVERGGGSGTTTFYGTFTNVTITGLSGELKA